MATNPPPLPPSACDAELQPFSVLHRGSSAKHPPRGRKPSPSSSSWEQLRLDAFRRTWSRIDNAIQEALRGINLQLFDQVLQWAFSSFSRTHCGAKVSLEDIQRPYPLLPSQSIGAAIPTAFLLTKNAEFVDDAQTFIGLASYLNSEKCHVVSLSAPDFTAKNGINGCIKALIRQLLNQTPNVPDISILASWYCERDNYNQPIIVIIDNIECCSGIVIGEFISLISEWLFKIPFLLVMGVATTLGAPRKILSFDALQLLQPCYITAVSPSDRMNAVVEAALVKTGSGFSISHDVALLLRDYFFKHDGTITSFISALKLACTLHFSMEPLSFLCLGMFEENPEIFWFQNFEALSDDMHRHVFDLLSGKSGNSLLNTVDSIVKGLLNLRRTQRDRSSVLMCLFQAGRHCKMQLLDIFTEVIDSEKSLCSLRSKVENFPLSPISCKNISKGLIAQVIQMIRDLPVPSLLGMLQEWSKCTEEMSEINGKVKELHVEAMNPKAVKTVVDKGADSHKRTFLSRMGKDALGLGDRVANLLDEMIRNFLVPLESTPFHEIGCFKNVYILQSALLVGPRKMIQHDLLHPQHYLLHGVCSNERTAMPSVVHDAAILYSLAQEHGDIINLHDWYKSFEATINNSSKAARKSHSSPASKKLKLGVDSVDSKARIQARFCRAVTEIQITGLIRMPNKRRPDFVQRIAIGE